ncbi:MAG: hypothetical protein GY699_05180, partial [Desulfobacteraceae bacterium]|nr:hypothetical protein [Desulfobacteraceae bacterium]
VEDAGVAKPFVEMRDAAYLKGLPPVKESNIQRNILIAAQDDIAGFILYNTSFTMRTMVNVAFKMYKDINLETAICKNYDAAILKAIAFLNIEITSSPQEKHKETGKHEKTTITQQDIDDFAELMGTIIWDEKETKLMDETTVTPKDHPLYKRSALVNLISEDIKESR